MNIRRPFRSATSCLPGILVLLALCSCGVVPSAALPDVRVGPTGRSDRALRSGEDATPAAGPDLPPDPLVVTVDEAILMALERNQALAVSRLAPEIRSTFEEEQRARFDPGLFAEGSTSTGRTPDSSGRMPTTGSLDVSGGMGVELPTGTSLSAGAGGSLATSNLRDDRFVTNLGLSINQALLQGASLEANLASIGQARFDTLSSEYELRGFTEALVATIEETYWDYALALRTIEIVANSLILAEKQVQETRERVLVGSLAETELAASEAELARRRENLINARSELASIRLRLLRLLNPRGSKFWTTDIELASVPEAPIGALDDMGTYVDIALRMRPDLNQARLQVQHRDLELVQTRNGLLPRLDLFVWLGKSGYAGSFGSSLADLDGPGHEASIGLRFDFPPANRAARARQARAEFSHRQARLALENLAQLVQVDVCSAYIEVERAREQVVATAATRRFQEETLRVETEKFRVGRSTSFLVAQAQRDLLESQIGEVRAVVASLKALIRLHHQQGALLERRGIAAPGGGPVKGRL